LLCVVAGNYEGQLYTYPAKRWKKKKRLFNFTERRAGVHGDVEPGQAGQWFVHVLSDYMLPKYGTFCSCIK
jgi:hypothetical protein